MPASSCKWIAAAIDTNRTRPGCAGPGSVGGLGAAEATIRLPAARCITRAPRTQAQPQTPLPHLLRGTLGRAPAEAEAADAAGGAYRRVQSGQPEESLD